MNVHQRTKRWTSDTVAASPVLAVIDAARMLEEELNAALAAVSLSMARMAVLHRLAGTAAVSVRDLAEALGCAKSNASVLSNRMVGDGHLVREPDPADRRGVLLSLTPAGAAAHRAGLEIVLRRQDELLAELSDRDRQTLLRLLGQIAR